MKKQAAFTLVELMVTVALALILASMVVPNIRSMLLNNRITSKTNTFIGAINYARGEAITRSSSSSGTIVVQPINTWKNGWRVWIDTNQNRTADDADIIKIFNFNDDQIEVNSDVPYIQYVYQGTLRSQNAMTFIICHKHYPRGRQVTISLNGKARTTRFDLASQGNGEYVCPPSS